MPDGNKKGVATVGSNVTIGEGAVVGPDAMVSEIEVDRHVRVRHDDILFLLAFHVINNACDRFHPANKENGEHNVSMNIYVIERQLLIDQIREAYVNGLTYFERDIISPQLDKLNVQAYQHDGYYARILDINTYFAENTLPLYMFTVFCAKGGMIFKPPFLRVRSHSLPDPK